jgi:acetoacetyl-CoA synthetase
LISEGELMWTPPPARVSSTRMAAFLQWLRRERGLDFADYTALWRWSTTDIDGFWAALWEHFNIISDSPYTSVSSGRDMISTRWFEGSRVNYAEHLLRHEAIALQGEVAFFHGSERRPMKALTWHALGDLVRAAATRLRAMGVRPGDRIVSYMPNVPETAVAMLASVAIGAVWSAASPEFGAMTVVDRFSQIKPRLIFAADGYVFGGKSFDRRTVLAEILAQLPTIETIVWLPYLGLEPPVHVGRPTVQWEDFVGARGPPPDQFKFERVAHDHPLWVLYSSGTTGLPKAITHSHIGIVIDQIKQMGLQFDLKPGKCMFFYTTTGWMMWNAVLAALFAGASGVLYDGSPTWPKIDALWDIAEESGTTAFGASPTLVQMMEKAGVRPAKSHNLSRLDTIILGGAPSTPATFAWFYANVKPDLWVITTSGGTDLCGGLVGPVPLQPVYAAEFQGRSLGMSVAAWSQRGEPVIDEVGELVVTKPFPSMPLYFWGDEGNRRYQETYFDMFPGVWRHGDFIKINERGGCYIYGRSDATLNRYGIRIGTSEIYGVLSGIKRVRDSIIVCCETGDGGFLVPMFIQLADDDTLDDALINEINHALRQQTSPRHLPDMIVQAPSIPYTLTGKKMEVPLRRMLMGTPVDEVASPDAMRDPAALKWYVEYSQRTDIRQRFKDTANAGRNS